MIRPVHLVVCIAACLMLAGCDSQKDDLDQWMKEATASAQPIKNTVEAPRKVEPFIYDNKTQVDPFSTAKLAVAIDRAAKAKAGNGNLAPDTKRFREALESFPLESIKMVGHIADAKVSTALLQVDTLVYQAKVGSYAGQNFGKIVKINDAEVFIKELVQDATGDWVERETSLRIREGVKQ
jgi:type IV pilus assembly protein PilP